jgi:hypothetical protein
LGVPFDVDDEFPHGHSRTIEVDTDSWVNVGDIKGVFVVEPEQFPGVVRIFVQDAIDSERGAAVPRTATAVSTEISVAGFTQDRVGGAVVDGAEDARRGGELSHPANARRQHVYSRDADVEVFAECEVVRGRVPCEGEVVCGDWHGVVDESGVEVGCGNLDDVVHEREHFVLPGGNRVHCSEVQGGLVPVYVCGQLE